MSSRTKGRLLILAAAVLFSTGGAAIKATAISGWQLASFRSFVAAVALAMILPAARRGWSRSSALVGVAYALTMILFVLATKWSTASSAIFLQSTAPLYVLVLSPFMLRETVTRRDLGLVAMMGAGMALILIGAGPPAETAPDPMRGNACAIGSGVAWALTLIGFRWLRQRPGGVDGAVYSAVFLGNVIAFIVALAPAFPLEAVRTLDGLMILYLGVFQIGLAYVCLTAGIREVAALEASFLILLEPVLNPIWVWIIHGERTGKLSLVGGMVIIGAVGLKAWIDARVSERSRASGLN